MIRQKVIVKQPRLKADGTGSIVTATMLEVTEADFNILNKLVFDKQECTLVLVPDGQYVDFIISEAKRLANED